MLEEFINVLRNQNQQAYNKYKLVIISDIRVFKWFFHIETRYYLPYELAMSSIDVILAPYSLES